MNPLPDGRLSRVGRLAEKWAAIRPRRCLLLVATWLVTVLSASVSASASAIGPAWQLPAGSHEEIGAHRMWLFGRQASLRTFDAPGNIADVALGLLAQVSTPPRLQAMPDGLLMAGMAGDVHWLVRLVATSVTRTQGTVSAVNLTHAASLPALSWQPSGMAVRFDVAAGDDAAVVRQQVLTDKQPADAVHRRLCSALQRHGWRPDNTLDSTPCHPTPLVWPASSFWQRDGATLAVVVDRQTSGSSIFVLQTDPLAPAPARWLGKLASRFNPNRPGDAR